MKKLSLEIIVRANYSRNQTVIASYTAEANLGDVTIWSARYLTDDKVKYYQDAEQQAVIDFGNLLQDMIKGHQDG